MIETTLKMFHLHDNITITGAQVLVDTTFVNPPPLFYCVPVIIYFAYKISNLGVFLFQYIKQLPEINGF